MQHIDFTFKHQIRSPGLIHGYACWFVAYFRGTTEDIELSTSPDKPCTHWYQMRLLLLDPLGGLEGVVRAGVEPQLREQRPSLS